MQMTDEALGLEGGQGELVIRKMITNKKALYQNWSAGHRGEDQNPGVRRVPDTEVDCKAYASPLPPEIREKHTEPLTLWGLREKGTRSNFLGCKDCWQFSCFTNTNRSSQLHQ